MKKEYLTSSLVSYLKPLISLFGKKILIEIIDSMDADKSKASNLTTDKITGLFICMGSKEFNEKVLYNSSNFRNNSFSGLFSNKEICEISNRNELLPPDETLSYLNPF